MAQADSAAVTNGSHYAPDAKPSDTYVGDHSCAQLAEDRVREYAATVRFLGLLAGIGDDKDVEAARSAVEEAIRNISLRTTLVEARQREEDARRAVERADSEFKRAHVLGASPQEVSRLEEARDEARQAYREAYDARTAVMHDKWTGFWSNLWSSCARIYGEVKASLENGTWLTALCRLGVDAGFWVLENGTIAAIGFVTGGAGAVVLKVTAKLAKAGARKARIFVRAQRRSLDDLVPDATTQESDVEFYRAIDTKSELTPPERRLLGEENQGTTEPDPKAGDVPPDGGGGRTGSGRAGDDISATEDARDEERAAAPKNEKTDVWPDGSYRNPNDPEGVRHAADGSAMIQDPRDPDRKWVRVADMKGPAYNNVKGNFGEAMGDQDAARRGWKKLDGPNTQIGDKIGRGIDAVYEDPGPPKEYVIVEDKYDTADLSTLKNGTKQMSPEWIRPRLNKAVGKKQALKIRMKGYRRVIRRTDPHGNVSIEDLGSSSWRGK